MKRARAVLAALALGSCLSLSAAAHEVRPGYLELSERSPGEYAFLWKRPFGGEVEIRIAPVFSAGCALEAPGGGVAAPGAVLLRGTLRAEGGLAGKTISIAGLEATITDVLVRVRHRDGREETHLLRPASPSVAFGGGSSFAARVLAYVRLGVEHILLGGDHLLFVLGLLLVVPGRMALVKTITAFTVAHSVTLAIATLGAARAPGPPLDAAIALSILFLGPEIVRARRGETSLAIRRPWLVAFAFGLLHGFGFASGLVAMGLPAGEIPAALLFFNAGVEAGQLLFVALMLLLASSFRVLEIAWPRAARALPGFAVGSLGAYWTIDRTLVSLGLAR